MRDGNGELVRQDQLSTRSTPDFSRCCGNTTKRIVVPRGVNGVLHHSAGKTATAARFGTSRKHAAITAASRPNSASPYSPPV